MHTNSKKKKKKKRGGGGEERESETRKSVSALLLSLFRIGRDCVAFVPLLRPRNCPSVFPAKKGEKKRILLLPLFPSAGLTRLPPKNERTNTSLALGLIASPPSRLRGAGVGGDPGQSLLPHQKTEYIPFLPLSFLLQHFFVCPSPSLLSNLQVNGPWLHPHTHPHTPTDISDRVRQEGEK